MGAVRRFSRGELGLNSVKCPVKHIKNTTFDFSCLCFPDGGEAAGAPQPTPASHGQEEDRLAGRQLRGQTGQFSSALPLFQKKPCSLYLFDVLLLLGLSFSTLVWEVKRA